ncbi:AfsR/SARP family transcriptional regulator [Streptomyces aureocirculatus]|uniref:AfsR/SARP family transcriptional regulator n=1 Tax=Streptomyces aureocirculatus TaxID=67275 RepID=UPI00068E2972|nr:BTAD domain-containing putative transcriptional regulator [Streptomyces aureocirculatus]
MVCIIQGKAGDERPVLRLRLLGGLSLSRQSAETACGPPGGGSAGPRGPCSADCPDNPGCLDAGTAEQLEVPASGQQVLARLALCGAATRSELAGTLWPDVTETRARASLRTAMWRLNGAGSAISDDRAGTLSLSDRVRVDTQDLISAAHQALSAESPPTTRARVLAIYQTLLCARELLPDWQQDWVSFERERLHQLRLHALEALSARLVARGQYAPALEAALESTRVDPLRESAHRAVVSVHLAEHNLTEAVRQYETFRELLLRELGVEPSGQFSTMLRHALV